MCESGRGQKQVLTRAAQNLQSGGSGKTLQSPEVWSQGSARVGAVNKSWVREEVRVLPEESVSGCNWYSSVTVEPPYALVCPAR